MNTYHFTIVIRDTVSSADIEDCLYEAGCSDALVCWRDRVPYLEFDREAIDAKTAVHSALDDIRRANHIEPTDKKGNGRVIQLAKEQARVHLRAGESFVFNATNLTRELRGKWTQLFANYRARIHITYLEVPWPQLLAQNKQRAHAVPEDVIRHLLGKLEIPGYDEAHEVAYVITPPQ